METLLHTFSVRTAHRDRDRRRSLGCVDVEERACMHGHFRWFRSAAHGAQPAGTRTAARDGSHLPCVIMDDGRKTKQGTHACTYDGRHRHDK
jgi:hypothetical protein